MSVEIDIRDICKSFGRVVALAGLTLEVWQGELFGLIGPDGAGKTTLLRILCGLYYADSGSCHMAGLDVRKNTRTIRAMLGYMPQRFSLYPDLTVAENMRFFADLFQVPAAERENRLQRLLKFSRLEPFVHRRAAALSGGMKQKLALSCTLIHTPRILLLDEPTTGVDPVSRREFWNILAELRDQGVTILITTPYMDEAAKCNRIAFFHKGKILLTTEPAKIPSFSKNILLQVHCHDQVRAAAILQESRAFANVKIFGDRLHVSGTESPTQMKQEISRLLSSKDIEVRAIESIPAGIEDVFMELMHE